MDYKTILGQLEEYTEAMAAEVHAINAGVKSTPQFSQSQNAYLLKQLKP